VLVRGLILIESRIEMAVVELGYLGSDSCDFVVSEAV
jgi:hypothetical protein